MLIQIIRHLYLYYDVCFVSRYDSRTKKSNDHLRVEKSLFLKGNIGRKILI